MSGRVYHEIVVLLRTSPDIYGEATPFRQVMLKATPDDLRDAIKDCLLSPSTTSVNRRRMGILATALLDRLTDALSDRHAADIRACAAEAKLKALQDAQPATAAALATLPLKPSITRLEPKPSAALPDRASDEPTRPTRGRPTTTRHHSRAHARPLRTDRTQPLPPRLAAYPAARRPASRQPPEAPSTQLHHP